MSLNDISACISTIPEAALKARCTHTMFTLRSAAYHAETVARPRTASVGSTWSTYILQVSCSSWTVDAQRAKASAKVSAKTIR
jgi:hypothetical protein